MTQSTQSPAYLVLSYAQVGIIAFLFLGFTTLKGQLIRSILYPKPHKFNFFAESIKFLLLLGSLTIIGFFSLLPNMLEEDARPIDILMTFLDPITITISPALPAAMQFGITFALNRLKSDKIFCISPPRILMSGRIETVCFDKTGTLTEDGMSLKGLSIIKDDNLTPSFITNIEEIRKNMIENNNRR